MAGGGGVDIGNRHSSPEMEAGRRGIRVLGEERDVESRDFIVRRCERAVEDIAFGGFGFGFGFGREGGEHVDVWRTATFPKPGVLGNGER